MDNWDLFGSSNTVETDSEPEAAEDLGTSEGTEQPSDDVVKRDTDTEDGSKLNDEIIEEWEVPSFLSDDYIPPDEFKSPDEEVKWYREHYIKAIDEYKTDGFKHNLLDAYKEELSNIELSRIDNLIKENRLDELRAKYPEFYSSLGLTSAYTKEEMESLATEYIKKQFGEDAIDRYDKEEAANNPNSLSGKVWKAYTDVMQKLDEVNQKNIEADKKYKPMTKQEQQALIEKQYEEDFKKYNIEKDDFNGFINELNNNGHPFRLIDIYTMKNMPLLVETAYQRGLKEGKQNVVGEIEKAGGKKLDAHLEEESKEDKHLTNYDSLDRYFPDLRNL